MSRFEAKFRRLHAEPETATGLATLFYLAVTVTGAIRALARSTRPAHPARYIRGLIADHLIEPRPAARRAGTAKTHRSNT